MTHENAAPRRAASGILHDNDGTRAPTGMIRQSIVRGIVGVQKRRAKSACDATAMLRFFRTRRGAARRRGVHYFQHRFCAFRPLTHSTVNRAHVHIYTSTRVTPLHPVDRPAALLSLPSNVSADEHFSNIRRLSLPRSLSLSFSFSQVSL